MRTKHKSESPRWTWVGWLVFSIPILLMIAIPLIQMFRKNAAVDWIRDQGGAARTEPGRLLTQIPPGTRTWLDEKLGGEEWSKRFEPVDYVNLETVDLEDKDFRKLAKFRQLKALALRNLPETGMKELKGFSGSLEGLYLWKSDVEVNQLKDLPAFTKIDLFFAPNNMTDEVMPSIGQLPQLRRLVMYNSQVTDAGLAHFSGLSELEELVLHGADLNGSGLVHLKGLPKLNHLKFGDTDMNDVGLEHLRVHSTLNYLSLSNTRITDAGLKHLGEIPSLGYLHIDNTRITDAGLVYLKGLTSLKRLGLEGTDISDAGLVHLQSLSFCLETLHLSDTKITDEGLKYLKGFSKLSSLDLSKTGITDEGLKHLVGLPALWSLKLGETRVTDAGVDRLKSTSKTRSRSLTITRD